MEIDNSRAQAFRLCPWFYYESYLRNGRGVQPMPRKGEGYSALELGGRVHELLEEYYKQRPGIYTPKEGPLEEEAQWMLQAYTEHYPADNWEIIDVEKTFRIELPSINLCGNCRNGLITHVLDDNSFYCSACENPVICRPHVYIGKIDLFIRDLSDGSLWVIDHKTEARGSKSHIPQKLAVTDQGSLYLWAARKIYGDESIGMKYNILTRPSEKGQKPPSFQDRYVIERSEHEIKIAVRDITLIADHIEDYTKRFGDSEWPANREECYGWGLCDYYSLHRFGEDPSLILRHKFQTREEYLNTEGVDVVK